jgi:hypothetical protein
MVTVVVVVVVAYRIVSSETCSIEADVCAEWKCSCGSCYCC